jgi:uncharacterized protein with PQ loop repeat
MGPFIAVLYAMLMVWGYASQVKKLHKNKRTDNLSLSFFILTFAAVALRILTVGLVIRDTSNITAIALEIAEFAVLGGLATIALQIIWYRHLKNTRRR